MKKDELNAIEFGFLSVLLGIGIILNPDYYLIRYIAAVNLIVMMYSFYKAREAKK